MILCSLQNLNLSFGEKVIFKDCQLTINKGDQVGILGLNGKGKSSLFKVLQESLIPDKTQPEFLFDKNKEFSTFLVPQEVSREKLVGKNIREFFFMFYPELEKIWFELEEINLTLDSTKSDEKLVGRQRDLLEKFEHLKGWELLNLYENYVKFFGIPNLEEKIDNMSGGELKKLLLSLGFSSQASVILWDEPTNHLDIETIELFQGELEQTEKTFLIISHDRYLISEVTNRIFHIQHGSILPFEGSYSQYLEHLSEKEGERLKLLEKLKNRHRRETEWMRQGIKARGTRSKKRVENYENLSGQIENLKGLAKKELSLNLLSSGRKTKKIASFENVSFNYSDKKIFSELSFELHKGDKVGIIGENGAGKSTLVKLITSDLKPNEGEVKLADDLVIRHFSQNRKELKDSQTPFELLGDGNDYVILPNGHKLHVASWFQKFLFHKSQLHRPLDSFSGGERSRLQLAMNLKNHGDIWIFDEPTNDLDLETIQLLEKTLNEFQGTLLVISHDRAFLSNITNRIFVIENEQIESFEGGYSHAEAYLEYRSLEKNLIGKNDASNDKKQDEIVDTEKVVTKKWSQSDQVKLEEIESKILEKEELLEKIDNLLQDLGSLQSNEDSVEKIIQLGQKKEEIEALLLDFYEEADNLNQIKDSHN